MTSVDSSPIVFCTALMANSTLYLKGFPLIFGQIVMYGCPIHECKVFLSKALAYSGDSDLAELFARV